MLDFAGSTDYTGQVRRVPLICGSVIQADVTVGFWHLGLPPLPLWEFLRSKSLLTRSRLQRHSPAAEAGSPDTYCERKKRPAQCLVTVSYSCPPPPPPSYVAHSSTHRDGGIELDNIEFLLSQYYTFTTPTWLGSNGNTGYFNSVVVSTSISVLQ